jgi:hypothetical protein
MLHGPRHRRYHAREQLVRTESHLQDHHRPDGPGCHRCGLPLLETATYCPYCERSIHEGPVARILHWRPAPPGEVRQPLITETRALAVAFVLFAVVAAAALVAALAI